MNNAPDAPDTPLVDDADTAGPAPRRRWVWSAAAAVGALAIAAAVIIPVSIANADHAAAVDQVHAALNTSDTVARGVDDETASHDQAVATSTAEVAALNSILEALPADLVDPATTRDELAAAIAKVTDAASQALPDLDAAAPDQPVVDDQDPTDQLVTAADQIRSRTQFLQDQRDAIMATTAQISTAVTAARSARDALLLAAIAKAPSIPIDRAGEAERTAVTTALDALRPVTQNGTGATTASADVLPLVTNYTSALAAARASHDAAIAAEQEAQRQEQERANAGSSGGDGSSGGSGSTRGSHNSGGGGGGGSNSGGGGSSGGGGGSSGGGSNSGGGSSGAGGGNSGGGSSGGGGGGGSTGPAWAPLSVARSGTDCYSSNVNGQQATYGSTLMVPGNAASYSTYEIPGYGWGVTWSCF